MIRVLWESRHNPLPSQERELKRLFGLDMKLIVDQRPFANAQEVAARFRAYRADELVLVAPLSVCRAVLNIGIQPLFAEMRRVPKGKSEVSANGRREKISGEENHYEFIKFKRLKSIKLELVDL